MTILTLVPSPGITPYGPTVFMTERNQHETRCGMCGRTIYVEEGSFGFVSDAIKAGLDEPFRCELCKRESNDSDLSKSSCSPTGGGAFRRI